MTDTALATATVVWRARAVGQDTDDPSGLPDEYPLAGVKVQLIPSPRKIEVAAPPGGVAPGPACGAAGESRGDAGSCGEFPRLREII